MSNDHKIKMLFANYYSPHSKSHNEDNILVLLYTMLQSLNDSLIMLAGYTLHK